MDNITIRKGVYEDIPSIVDIKINGWKIAYKGIIDDEFLNSMKKETHIKRMQDNYKKTNIVVAQVNNKVVGFCRYLDNNSFSENIENADCEIIALYVLPELKRQGIGTKMFNYVKRELKAKNKNHMVIWCLKENKNSKKFYEKMGGTIVAEKQATFEDKQYPKVCFIFDIQK